MASMRPQLRCLNRHACFEGDCFKPFHKGGAIASQLTEEQIIDKCAVLFRNSSKDTCQLQPCTIVRPHATARCLHDAVSYELCLLRLHSGDTLPFLLRTQSDTYRRVPLKSNQPINHDNSLCNVDASMRSKAALNYHSFDVSINMYQLLDML